MMDAVVGLLVAVVLLSLFLLVVGAILAAFWGTVYVVYKTLSRAMLDDVWDGR